MLTCGNTGSEGPLCGKLSGEFASDTSGPDTETRPPAGASTGMEPAVTNTIPPDEPGCHGWVELLTLVGDLRRLAYDSSLDDE